jgi:hypothetical protein
MLSLLDDYPMQFRHLSNGEFRELFLERRSLCVIEAPAATNGPTPSPNATPTSSLAAGENLADGESRLRFVERSRLEFHSKF